MPRPGFVYILSNTRRTVLYTGVTSDLRARLTAHRTGRGSDFARRYNATDLVYVERYDDVQDAIRREKQIKAGSRARKDALIALANPELRDLCLDLTTYESACHPQPVRGATRRRRPHSRRDTIESAPSS